jgi:hypothetical protein
VLGFKGLRAEILLQSAILAHVPGTPSHFSAKPRGNERPLCHGEMLTELPRHGSLPASRDR